METIFISIASCKEEFLLQTIKSAICSSDNPELLYFGISNMVIDEKDFLSDKIFNQSNIKTLQIKFDEALGTGFGRMTASLLADRDHTYLLQVDAQNIFEKGWDTQLKNAYIDLLKICDKPIISTSPRRWIDGPNKEVYLQDEKGPVVNPYDFKTTEKFSSLKIKIAESNSLDNDGTFEKFAFIEGLHHQWEDEDHFIEHGLIHASFMFTSFNFTREIMHDPLNPWDGDQINLSFRAGTRGYRMFVTKNCVVWSKDKFNNGLLISDNDWRRVPSCSLKSYYNWSSRNFQKQLFSGNYLGYWGAPNKDSIKKYYDYIGVDLSKYFN
jgi:hypothetical protein